MPSCVAPGCRGSGVLHTAEGARPHELVCKSCGATWQSSWWCRYLHSEPRGWGRGGAFLPAPLEGSSLDPVPPIAPKPSVGLSVGLGTTDDYADASAHRVESAHKDEGLAEAKASMIGSFDASPGGIATAPATTSSLPALYRIIHRRPES
jgi:hypothetical protein